MTDFIADVVREVRSEVRARDYGANLPPRPVGARTSLRAAIQERRNEGAIVVEFKRVSPGRPDPVLPSRSAAAFVRAIEPAAPAGYSCLATASRFGGSPADVADLARETTRPVLFKDFVLEPEQIEAAARSGASAVLLIARLEVEGYLRRSLTDLAKEAHAQGLEVLLEFHRSAELSRADGVGADVFGVNVRDLGTLALDRETAARTIGAAKAAGLSPLLVLSGVSTPADAQAMWSEGVDGLLVGSAVARAEDPARFVRSIRRGTAPSDS